MPEERRQTWLWDDVSSWEGKIRRLISDVATEPVIAAFRRAPPEYVVSDDLSWLDNTVLDVTGRFVDMRLVLAERLPSLFTSMRAYHGTRTDDVAGFYDRGLEPLNAVAFQARAREIFLVPEFSELTPGHLEAAIEDVGHRLREGRLYFTASQSELVELCGHYMLYGSEYLTAIAAHLPGYRDYRQILKRIGQPTVFVCDVPFSLIRSETLLEFAGIALEVIFQRILDASYQHPQPGAGAGFSVRATLPPSCIASHFHPVGVRDPLRA